MCGKYQLKDNKRDGQVSCLSLVVTMYDTSSPPEHYQDPQTSGESPPRTAPHPPNTGSAGAAQPVQALAGWTCKNGEISKWDILKFKLWMNFLRLKN